MSSHSSQVPSDLISEVNGHENESMSSSTSPTEVTSSTKHLGKEKSKEKTSSGSGSATSISSSKETSSSKKRSRPQSASGPLPITYSIGNEKGTVEKFMFDGLNGAYLNGAFKAPQFKSRNQAEDIPMAPQNEGISPVQMAVAAQSGQPMVACWRFGARSKLPKKTQRRVDRNNRNSLQRVQLQAESVTQAQVPLPQLPPQPAPPPKPVVTSTQPGDPNVVSRQLALLQTGDASVASLVPMIPYVADEQKSKKRRRKDLKFTIVNSTVSTSTVTVSNPDADADSQSADSRQQTSVYEAPTPDTSAAEELIRLHEASLKGFQTGPATESGPEAVPAAATPPPPVRSGLFASAPGTPLPLPENFEDILGAVELSEGFAVAMARPNTPPPAAVISLPASPRSVGLSGADATDGFMMPIDEINQFLMASTPTTVRPTDIHTEPKSSSEPVAAPQVAAEMEVTAGVSDIAQLVAQEEQKQKADALSPKKHKHKHHKHSCRKYQHPVLDL